MNNSATTELFDRHIQIQIALGLPPNFTLLRRTTSPTSGCLPQVHSFCFSQSKQDEMQNRLSNLPSSVFACTTFAVCNDGAGNKFLQGFARPHKRFHKALLHREISDNAACDAPQRNEDTLHVPIAIQLGQFPEEFGSAMNSRFESHINKLKEFKRTIDKGITTPEKLSRKSPELCFVCPPDGCWTHDIQSLLEHFKKDGDLTETGTAPKFGRKKMSDLEEFKASAKEGVTSIADL